MNQKKCPQCKNLISVTAPTCLHCGRPNKFVTNKYVKSKWNKDFKKKKLNNFKSLFSEKILFIYIFIFIIFLIILYKQKSYLIKMASITSLVLGESSLLCI